MAGIHEDGNRSRSGDSVILRFARLNLVNFAQCSTFSFAPIKQASCMQVWYAGDVIHKRGCMPTLLYGSLYVYTVFCSLYLGCLVAIDAQDHCCKHVCAQADRCALAYASPRGLSKACARRPLRREPRRLDAHLHHLQQHVVVAKARRYRPCLVLRVSFDCVSVELRTKWVSGGVGVRVGVRTQGGFRTVCTLLASNFARKANGGRPWACIDTQTKNGDHQAQIQRCLLEVVGAQRLQHSLGAVFVLLGCLRVAQNPDAAIDSVRDVRVRAYKRRVCAPMVVNNVFVHTSVQILEACTRQIEKLVDRGLCNCPPSGIPWNGGARPVLWRLGRSVADRAAAARGSLSAGQLGSRGSLRRARGSLTRG